MLIAAVVGFMVSHTDAAAFCITARYLSAVVAPQSVCSITACGGLVSIRGLVVLIGVRFFTEPRARTPVVDLWCAFDFARLARNREVVASERSVSCCGDASGRGKTGINRVA